MRIHKGDHVQVIAGKDKGAKGRVLATLPEKNKVIVEGVNRVTKHTKVSTSQRGAKQGGIEHQEAPIHVSNVQLIEDGKATRVGITRDEETGRPVRVSRRTGKPISRDEK
jgi:large subunit ribosomal protein L24